MIDFIEKYRNLACAIFGHKWRWYLTNYERTVT